MKAIKPSIQALCALFAISMTTIASGRMPNGSWGGSPAHTFWDTTFVGAQPEAKLTRYIEELRRYDINIAPPEGYSSIDIRGRNHIENNIAHEWPRNLPIADDIAVAIESKDNDAVICFPSLIYGDSVGILRGANEISMEIRANKRLPSGVINDGLDVRPYLNIIAKDDMSEYAEADTAIIYDLELQSRFLSQYPYMVGVYLRKKCYPALNLKIALTKDSYEDKDKYVKLLLDNISYGGNPMEYLIEAEAYSARKGGKDSLQ